MSGPVPVVAAVGLRLLVAGAFLAWVAVLGIFAWLMLSAPQLVASWKEAGVALPGLTELAVRVVGWMQAHWQMVGAGALVPLVLLLVMRKAVVAVVALGMIFAAGAVAGGLAVAFWLPEQQLREWRAYQQGGQQGDIPVEDAAPPAIESQP